MKKILGLFLINLFWFGAAWNMADSNPDPRDWCEIRQCEDAIPFAGQVVAWVAKSPAIKCKVCDLYQFGSTHTFLENVDDGVFFGYVEPEFLLWASDELGYRLRRFLEVCQFHSNVCGLTDSVLSADKLKLRLATSYEIDLIRAAIQKCGAKFDGADKECSLAMVAGPEAVKKYNRIRGESFWGVAWDKVRPPSVPRDWCKIRKWEDVEPFTGSVIAWSVRSNCTRFGSFSGKYLISQADVFYGYTKNGFWLHDLVKKGAVSLGYSLEKSSVMGAADLKMRFAMPHEIDLIRIAIVAGVRVTSPAFYFHKNGSDRVAT